MVQKTYKIINKTGLDAKMASTLVNKCSKYACDILLISSNMKVNLKSIMGVMSLNIHKGEIVDISFNGVDEEDAYNDISYLIQEIKLAKEF